MELKLTKTKYKRTDFGLIPEDWELHKNDTVSKVIDSLHQTPVFSNSGYPMIRVTDIKKGNLSTENTLKVSFEVFKTFTRNYKPKKGDIVISRVGSYGVTSFVSTDEEFCLGQNTAIIEPKINAQYLYQVLNSKFINRQIELESYGTGYKSLSLRNIKELLIPIPKTDIEQKAIANALSDVDDLINNLEKLIAKKKAIKQGAMQQLLTPPNKGGKRLAGYLGEWINKPLEAIANIKTGGKNNQDKIAEGEYPFFVRSQTIEKINTYSYDGEAILIPGEGGIGTIFHYINGKFDVHQRVYKISDFEPSIYGKYVYLIMLFSFYNHAMKNSVKATVDSLRLPTFQEFEIDFPPSKEEQISISNVIFDIDDEIKTLENKKAKFHNIKQGMMQELLTGRTRLV